MRDVKVARVIGFGGAAGGIALTMRDVKTEEERMMMFEHMRIALTMRDVKY